MDKIRRNERMSAMMKILAAKPNRIFTLSYFCDLFGSAKSTMSEDIDILRDVVAHFGLGELETVTGAAGGVRYRTKVRRPEARKFIGDLCQQLSEEGRVLPGGFLYYSDILSTPEIVTRMGEIMATEYYAAAPDFVLTMETKGIPVAFATANALGVPLVIARRSSKVYEGSAVNINYVSGVVRPYRDDEPFAPRGAGGAEVPDCGRLSQRRRHGEGHGRPDARVQCRCRRHDVRDVHRKAGEEARDGRKVADGDGH